MFDKSQLTRQILQGLPPDDCPVFDQAFAAWWMDSREGGGMRLTTAGYQAIATFDIEMYVCLTFQHTLCCHDICC